MGQPLKTSSPMTEADFLAWEAGQPERWEFLDGEVWTMVGGTKFHNRAALNLAIALDGHLPRGGPCRVFMNDVKLHVAARGAYFYPDLMVSCSAADAADPLVVREPVLVVEILSPSTAAYDHGKKFDAYRRLDSLREVVMVDIDGRRCDAYRRAPGSPDWVFERIGVDEPLALRSVGLTVGPEVLWDRIDLPPPDDEPPEGSREAAERLQVPPAS